MVKFEGWGTSLCWWANVNYPKHIKEQLIKLLFSKDGLELNIVRYNLGGGYNENKMQNMRQGALMPCIIDENILGHFVFNLHNDNLQIDIMSRSIMEGVNKVELFSNSPPYWMTKSGFTNGSYHNFECNLKEIENFSNYLTECYKFLKGLYPIVSLSPFNEPSNPFWTVSVNQEGCYYDYNTRKQVLKKIKETDPNIVIAGVEEFSSGFGLFWQMFSWNNNIDRINIHGYHLKYKDITFYFDDFNFIRRIFRFFTTKDIWMSEFGWGYPDTIKETLPFARQIFRDLDTFKCKAWIYWQAVENTIGNWGLIQIDFNNPTQILIKKQYYIFKHFTKFLKENDIYTIERLHFFGNVHILKINNGQKYIILNDTDNYFEYKLPCEFKIIVQSCEEYTYKELNKIPKLFQKNSITSIEF